MSVTNHLQSGEVYPTVPEGISSPKESVSSVGKSQGHEYQVVDKKNDSIETISGMVSSWMNSIPAEKKEGESKIQATPIKNPSEANKALDIFATKGPESIFVFDEIQEEKKAETQTPQATKPIDVNWLQEELPRKMEMLKGYKERLSAAETGLKNLDPKSRDYEKDKALYEERITRVSPLISKIEPEIENLKQQIKAAKTPQRTPELTNTDWLQKSLEKERSRRSALSEQLNAAKKELEGLDPNDSKEIKQMKMVINNLNYLLIKSNDRVQLLKFRLSESTQKTASTQPVPLSLLHTFEKVAADSPFDAIVEDQKNETKAEVQPDKAKTEKQTNSQPKAASTDRPQNTDKLQNTSSTGNTQNISQTKQPSEKFSWKGTLVKIIGFILSPYMNRLINQKNLNGSRSVHFGDITFKAGIEKSLAQRNKEEIIKGYKELAAQIDELTPMQVLLKKDRLDQKILETKMTVKDAYVKEEHYTREVNKTVAKIQRLKLNFNGPFGADYYMNLAGNKEEHMQHAKKSGDDYSSRLDKEVEPYRKVVEDFIENDKLKGEIEKLKSEIEILEGEIKEQRRLLDASIDENISSKIKAKIQGIEEKIKLKNAKIEDL